ncbi:MAG TPA: hypothetical protein VKY40_00205 [Halanaerobiales bacterium]|nr:hypothetical protein [Halanaerobiales bacterium]
MKRKIFVLSVIMVLAWSFLVSASDQWSTSVSKDEMTGEEVWYAISPKIEATEKMGFPYSNVKAWIGIGYDGENEWVYVGFTEAPNLLDTTIKDGYNLIKTRIKWDDNDPEYIRLTQDWGAKFLHFQNDETVISQIIKSNNLLLELNWYGEGNVYYRFPLNGSSKAIDKIYNAFEN